MRLIIRGKRNKWDIVLYGMLYIVCIIILTLPILSFLFSTTSAYAARGGVVVRNAATTTSCAKTSEAQPGPSSLLVILLDRSGSLIAGPQTDPHGYSTSVTKALADLWPGRMAVIPFGGDTLPLSVLGPKAMSDPTQRDELKNEIDRNQPRADADTPLGPAMQQALGLFKQAAPGSRGIIITDGMPTGIDNNTGPDQERLIRSSLIPQFCQLGIAISPFGLKIDTSTSDGQDADALLTDITRGTQAGQNYTRIQSAEELAREVIGLYAEWQGLSFTPEAHDTDGTYHVFINDLAAHATIVAFRSDQQYPATLLDSNGATLNTAPPGSIDTHYKIYNLNMSTFASGTYKVDTGSDNDAQVYALIDSRLLVQLIEPNTSTTINYDQPLTIRAALYDGHNLYVPQGEAELSADVTFHTQGQPDTTIAQQLQQQDRGVFSLQLPPYKQPGQVSVVVHAKYQGVVRETQPFTFQLSTPPPPPCHAGPLPCLWQEHQPLVISLSAALAILLALLAILLAQKNRPRPFGYLRSQVDPEVDLPLTELRKPIINASDIRTHPKARRGFPLGAANFELVFTRDHKAYIRPAKLNTVPISIQIAQKSGEYDQQEGKPSQPDLVDLKQGKEVLLPYGSVIIIRGDPIASFEALPRPRNRKF